MANELVRMKLWQSGTVALLALVFWVTVLLMPDQLPPWPTWVVWVAFISAPIIIVAGAVVFARAMKGEDSEHRGEFVFTGVFVAILGLVVFIVTLGTRNGLDLSGGRSLALGVGGVAIVGFAFATTQYDTIRAAASVAVVILLIGVTTWPGATEAIGADVRAAIIQWMGVLLGINGAAEAAKQVGVSVAQANSPTPLPPSHGDLAPHPTTQVDPGT